MVYIIDGTQYISGIVTLLQMSKEQHGLWSLKYSKELTLPFKYHS